MGEFVALETSSRPNNPRENRSVGKRAFSFFSRGFHSVMGDMIQTCFFTAASGYTESSPDYRRGKGGEGLIIHGAERERA